MSRQFQRNHFRKSRKREPGASDWSCYDPYFLETQTAYGRHWHRFPEDPVEPRIIEYPCREGFLMPVTADDVRETLARIPAGLRRGLQAIFLLAGTRKQEKGAWGDGFSFGCYWSDCVFLHPFPESMMKTVYPRPPKPSDLLDYARVGAQITEESEGTVVRFDARSLRMLYLYDVLVHEIGHHVDRANLGNTKENEAFAKWFATEFGFRRRRADLQLARAPEAP